MLTFGSNEHGCIGHANKENWPLPTAVAALADSKVEGVAAGAMHTVVLLADGGLRAFGNNEFGQLGADSASRSSTEPVVVALPA